MRVGLLIGGIILMIIGVIAYFSVQQSISDCGSFIGQLGRAFSSTVAQRCQTSQFIQLGGAGLFVIGLGLTIGGAVSRSK